MELAAQLELPPFPEAIRYLWLAYWEIRKRRGGNGFRALPISWGDIDAFARLTDAGLAPWEVKVITALDDAWLNRLMPQAASISGNGP